MSNPHAGIGLRDRPGARKLSELVERLKENAREVIRAIRSAVLVAPVDDIVEIDLGGSQQSDAKHTSPDVRASAL